MNIHEKYDRFKKQPEWLQNYLVGIEGKLHYTLIYEGKKYALIKSDGYSWYYNVYNGMKYSPITYYICPIGVDYWHNIPITIFEGRCKKEKIEEFKKYIDNCDDGENPQKYKIIDK